MKSAAMMLVFGIGCLLAGIVLMLMARDDMAEATRIRDEGKTALEAGQRAIQDAAKLQAEAQALIDRAGKSK